MKANIGIWILAALTGLLALYLLGTLWQYLVFALLFAIIFNKNYRELRKHMHPNLAALLVVLSVFVLLVGPTLYVLSATITQAPQAYQGALDTLANARVQHVLGVTANDVQVFMVGLGDKLKANVLANVGNYLAQASTILLGLFIMFISLFFFIRDGEKIRNYLFTNFPVGRAQTEHFFTRMHDIIRSVLLGQIASAIAQGILGGLLFWAVGIPNPLFWGVVMILLSIIPVLGPFLLYLPAALYLVLQDHYVRGIIVLLFGILILSQIDNVIRTYVAARTSKVHPLLVILGVIGGLQLWGLSGFILGPLILAAFLTLYEFAVRTVDTR